MCEGNRRRSFSLSQTLGPKVLLPLRAPDFPETLTAFAEGGRVAWPPNSAPPPPPPPINQSS